MEVCLPNAGSLDIPYEKKTACVQIPKDEAKNATDEDNGEDKDLIAPAPKHMKVEQQVTWRT